MSDIARAEGHRFHSDARAAWQQQNLRWETENAFLNHQTLFEAMTRGRAKCLSQAPKAAGPCIIIGSGSSLDGVVARLKDWKGDIVCSTSHGTTLVRHGAFPKYVSCLDPRVAPDPELDVPAGGWNLTSYLAHVSTPKAYFDKWFASTPSTAYVFRILEPTVPWYTKHLIWAYPWVKAGLLPFIDSLSSEITLASQLGYDPIFCIGADYGGPRFKQWLWKGGKWEEGAASGAMPNKMQDIRGNEFGDHPITWQPGPGGIPIDPSMTYSKRGMLIGAYMKMMSHKYHTRIYQMSKPSNILEFPFVSFDEVLERNGDFPLWDSEYRAQVAEGIEVSLARTDTFLIPIEGGFGTDYRVFMMEQQHVVRALSELNAEVLTNKADLVAKEKSIGLSIAQQIEKGIIVVESGELIIHDRADLADFDVQRMRGVDVEKTAAHLQKVYEASKS